MCMFSAPKVSVPTPPAPAQMQAAQLPKDMTQNRDSSTMKLRRRGMWASIMTSPLGISGKPTTTGGGAGSMVTGG